MENQPRSRVVQEQAPRRNADDEYGKYPVRYRKLSDFSEGSGRKGQDRNTLPCRRTRRNNRITYHPKRIRITLLLKFHICLKLAVNINTVSFKGTDSEAIRGVA